MIMKRIIYVFALTVTLAGCNELEKTEEKSSLLEIKFEVEYPGAASKATAVGFEPGDVTGLYMTEWTDGSPVKLAASGNAVNNARLTFDGESWESRPKTWWDIETKYDVYGYYPYSSPSSVDEYRFSVREDQSTLRFGSIPGGYEASDFLWAKTSGVSYPQKVSLKFSHRMSRLVINLVKGEDFEGDFPDDISVKIHGVVTDAVIDLGAGVVTKDARATTHSITTRKEAEGKYAAILVPQNITRRQPLIEILSGNVSYLLESRLNLKSGVEHKLNITLNSDPSKVRIDIGGEVQGWS